MLRVISAFVTALLLGSLVFLPPAPAQTTKPASVFGDWTAHTHQDAKAKICYAASQPKTQEPKAAKRDPAFFYVSAWPKDGVKTEVSVKIGYPLKKDSEVTVTVGKDTFKLFTNSERAFVSDPAQELQADRDHEEGLDHAGAGHIRARHRDHRHVFAERAAAGDAGADGAVPVSRWPPTRS